MGAPSRRIVGVALVGILVAACSSTASPSGAASAPPAASAATASTAASVAPSQAAPSVSASAAPSASAQAASTPPSAGPTAVATAVDPCQLVTQAEAKALSGAAVAAGRESSTAEHLRICTYGVLGTDVNILTAQAPDQATMDKVKAEALAEMAKAGAKGIKTTTVSGLGDSAALVTYSASVNGLPFNLTAVYVVKGTQFFEIFDGEAGRPSASPAAIEALAATALSRLP